MRFTSGKNLNLKIFRDLNKNNSDSNNNNNKIKNNKMRKKNKISNKDNILCPNFNITFDSSLEGKKKKNNGWNSDPCVKSVFQNITCKLTLPCTCSSSFSFISPTLFFTSRGGPFKLLQQQHNIKKISSADHLDGSTQCLASAEGES